MDLSLPGDAILPSLSPVPNLFNLPDLDQALDDLFNDLFDNLDEIDVLDGLKDVLGGLNLDDGLEFGQKLLLGQATSDRLIGLISNDVLLGLVGNDTLLGLQGNDILDGGGGNDILRGAGGSDVLIGQLGRDRLEGGASNDVLTGGKGLDTLVGGGGDDTFVLELRNGLDRIQDFSDRTDVLQLPQGIRFRDLTLTPQGLATVLSYGNLPLAILTNVAIDQLTKADFITAPST